MVSLSFQSCNIIMSSFGFSRVGPLVVVFDRDTPGSRRLLRKLLYYSTDPRGVLRKLISFSALHNVRESVFLMSLDASNGTCIVF